MRKVLLVILAVSFTFYLFGCAKKEAGFEEGMEPLSMEALGTTTTMPSPVTEAKVEPQVAVNVPMAATSVTVVKPTAIEIQTALKNANLYMGEIDGKIGPKTKKAIEEFQKTNGLKVDGKVGVKTWEALSKYLNIAPAAGGNRR